MFDATYVTAIHDAATSVVDFCGWHDVASHQHQTSRICKLIDRCRSRYVGNTQGAIPRF